MPDTCIKKFNVAFEVANFISYVKYIKKDEDDVVKNIVDSIYELINVKPNINKKEIENIINLHRNQLTPSMLREDKFSLPYNPINDKYVNDIKGISDSYNAQFVIRTNTHIETRFNKNEYMNQLTDLYKHLFILDLRYYGIEKKYFEVEFELRLTEKSLYLNANDEKLVNKFLEQYSLNDVCEILGIKIDIEYEHFLTSEDVVKENITDIFPFNNQTLLEHLVDCYEVGNCVFINNMFLNTIDVDFKDLIKPLNKPKLLVVLEKQDYSYFSKHHNSRINRIEEKDNNIIVYVDEHLFREAIGNSGYLLIMNDTYKVTLNKLSKEYAEVIYLGKGENKNLNIFKNILNRFFDIKKTTTFIDNLSLLAFVLNEEEINSSLNYFLVNTLKGSNSALRFNLEAREQLPYHELKKLVNLYYLVQDLNKNLVLRPNNVKLLLDDMLNMVKKIDDIEKLKEYNIVMDEVLKIFKINVEEYEVEINKINTLLKIKETIFNKDRAINFILDTSVLMDEPDIFHKYFNNNSVIVHSVIKDELEHFRGSNINAVRAMRNIHYLKNNPNTQLQFIEGEKPNTEFTKLYKVKVFENLMAKLKDEGKYPVIVSNDDELTSYKSKNGSVIELDHIPLLF